MWLSSAPLGLGVGKGPRSPALGALQGSSPPPSGSLPAFIPLPPAVPGLFWGSSLGRSDKSLLRGPLSCDLLSPVSPTQAGWPVPCGFCWDVGGAEDPRRRGACLQPFSWPLLMP